MGICMETLAWAYTDGHFLEGLCVWREVSLQRAYVWNHVRDPGMGIHMGAFLRTTYMHLGRGVLALGI